MHSLYLEFTCQEIDSDGKEDLQYHLPTTYQALWKLENPDPVPRCASVLQYDL